jgi:esterase/lipase superfamily enzyme
MKVIERWLSPRLERPTQLVRWGFFGAPVLLFPTAGGDAEECERFLLIDALAPLIGAGRIKVYSIDSIAGRTWIEKRHHPAHAAWIQSQFHSYVNYEVIPAIRADCRSESIEVIAAGASLGAYNAVAATCRFPDAFRMAIGMSGTYDLESYMQGHRVTDDFYFSSPLHFLPGLGGWQLDKLRQRFILLALGTGRWESPEQSWRMAGVLGDKGVPNRVDLWGPEWDHDWPTWRRMLPQYLAEITG